MPAITDKMKQINPETIAQLNEDGYRQLLEGISHQLYRQLNQPDPSTVSQQHHRENSNDSSPGKRHLPVAAKEMIYNEWAAVLNHQDEMHHIQKIEDRRKQLDLQSRYRDNLEQQKEDQVKQAMH